MKLRGFIWSLLGMAFFMLAWRFFTQAQGLAGGYFILTLILVASGLELVRSELADVRRAQAAKDGATDRAD